MEPDAHVVGAGPAGAVFAREAAARGLKVLVSEEHSRVGAPVQCSGLISKRGMESLGVRFRACVLHELRGAHIYSPRLSRITVGNGKARAYVVDRQRMDVLLAASAEKAGAVIETGKRVAKSGLRGRLIVGADGACSPVAHWFGFPKIPSFAICMQADYEGASLPDEGRLMMFLSNERFPGLFGWVIPGGKGMARVGVGMRQNGGRAPLLRGFEDFISKNKIVAEALDGAKETSRLSGIIPVGARKETAKGNVLLVGDAAGQVKATTGGGVVFGTAAARIAAENAAAGRPAAQYEAEWRERLGAELALHSRLRQFLDSLDDARLEAYFNFARGLGAEEFLNEHGDMDNISPMLSSLKGYGKVVSWLKRTSLGIL